MPEGSPLVLPALALLLSAQAAPAPLAESAAETLRSLDAARRTIEELSLCPARPESPYEALVRREAEARADAIGLFGAAFDTDRPMVDLAAACAAGEATTLERRAAAELDAATAAFVRATAAMPGLWIGTMRLCGPAVVAVEDGFSDYGEPTVVIRFAPAAARQLASETAARVAQPMAIRLDGELVSAPLVAEPITGGEIQIQGGDVGAGVSAARLAAAARRPC